MISYNINRGKWVRQRLTWPADKRYTTCYWSYWAWSKATPCLLWWTHPWTCHSQFQTRGIWLSGGRRKCLLFLYRKWGCGIQ